MKTDLLRLNNTVQRDPTIDTWLKEHSHERGTIATYWFRGHAQLRR